MARITGVNHTSFTVSDLDKAVAFFRDVLGATVLSVAERPKDFSERVTGIPGARLYIGYVGLGGHKIELIQYLEGRGTTLDVSTNNVGSGHICFDVDDARALQRALQAKGVRFVAEPMEIPIGANKGGFATYFKGPDGITIEFIQPPAR
ncbi:MAG TPA: VOC family protein [Candidatus Sulfotelmatobacter sp.]|nr:VOC family protein [Candidatus Sulfotelmatobacter sp.]